MPLTVDVDDQFSRLRHFTGSRPNGIPLPLELLLIPPAVIARRPCSKTFSQAEFAVVVGEMGAFVEYILGFRNVRVSTR